MNPGSLFKFSFCVFICLCNNSLISLNEFQPNFYQYFSDVLCPTSGADPGFFKGGVKAMVICINYIISYCNYSHYYFKRSAL